MMGRLHVVSEAAEQPDSGHDEQKPHTAPYGRLDESQAHQARNEIARPVLGSCEVVINPEPIRLAIIPVSGRKYTGSVTF